MGRHEQDRTKQRSQGALSVRATFESAWSMYPSQALRILTLLLGWAIVWVVVEILVIASRSAPGRPIWLLLHLGYFWGTAYWEVAILRCALDSFERKRPALSSVLPNHRLALRFLSLKLLLIPATLVGTALLVIPGLYVMARYGISSFFVVDRACGPWKALALSSRASRGDTLQLMLLFLMLLVFNALGAAMLGLGLVITAPMTALAVAYVFRTVSGRPVAGEA